MLLLPVGKGRRGTDQYEDWSGQEVQGSELDLARPDLLAEVLRSPANHQTGHEDSEDRNHEQAVQTRTDASWRDLTEHHVDDRQHAAECGVRVVEGVHRTGRRQSGRSGEGRRVRHAEPDLLALHRRSHCLRDGAGSGQLERVGQDHTHDGQHDHDGENGVALAVIADHPAEQPGHAERDHQQEEVLQPACPARRVLERVG